MENNATLHIFYARNGKAVLVRARVAAADHHDTNSSTLVELNLFLCQCTRGNTFEKVDKVALQTQHHSLRLRVAHADIVLDDLRLAINIDESEEDKAFILDAFRLQTLNSGTDNAVFHLFHPCLVGKRNRAHAAHAARVQAGVALANALVVLRLGQNLIAVAIGQNKHTALDAVHKLLDDNTTARAAKHAAKHLFQLLLRLFQRRQNKNTLAGTQAIGLQNIRSLQRTQESLTLGHSLAGKCLVGRGGDTMPLHERFGKVFTAFQYGTLFTWAYDGNAFKLFFFLEEIIYTIH